MMGKMNVSLNRLTTEYQQNPIGLDVVHPRFGWQLQSSARNVLQQAYQIQVRAAIGSDSNGHGEIVWDSGKVASSQTIHVVYEGTALRSDTTYNWSVRIWDSQGNESDWSDNASFHIGLIDKDLIKGEWIGLPKAADLQTASFGQARWMRHPQPAPDEQEDRETVFRLTFTLDESELQGVRLLFTQDGVPEAYVNGKLCMRRGWHSYHRAIWVDLDDVVQKGENVLHLLCDPSKQAELSGTAIARLTISATDREYVSGEGWQTAYTLHEMFTEWHEGEEDWVPSQATSAEGEEPWTQPMLYPKRVFSATRNETSLLRKSFSVKGEVISATLYASALGIYEPRLNGDKVGLGHLAPGWTDYSQRVMIQAYQVKELLTDGDHVLGAQLGEGWYAGNVGPFGVDHYGIEPRLWMQLRIQYADGREAQIFTDGSWRVSRGPIQFSDILYGEIYDARLAQAGWDTAGFTADNWLQPKTEKLNKQVLVGQVGPEVEVIETLKPKTIVEKFKGVSSINVGQNIAGILRLRLNGTAGTSVTIRYGEMLREDGSLLVQNLRGARQTDTYILSGAGEEWYQPVFTYHGFQFVEVTGLDYILTAEDIEIKVMHSTIAKTGQIHTSNHLVNQLFSNADWCQRSNFMSVPTDCPQRDERMGWLGDAGFFATTAAYNRDVNGFFQKWLRDVVDAQSEDGAFPDIAPDVGKIMGKGNAAWADAGVIIPWTMYLMYGDKKILTEMYPHMQRYMDFLESHSENGIRPDYGFGDWLSLGEETPKDVMQTAYYGYSALLMRKISVVLGYDEYAEKYEKTRQCIRKSFQEHYVDQSGKIKGHTQTSYVLALKMELLDEIHQEQAFAHLVSLIESNDHHLTTGITSTVHLLPTLTRYGRSDLATKLLLQETYPGWLYSVKQGATSIWERWDSWSDENGFQTPAMNSFNHYAVGAVLEWMYRELAGIATVEDQPGFARLHLKPHPDLSLSVVEVSYESVHGLIESFWKYTDTGWEWRVTIPANVTALMELPGADSSKVLESGQLLTQSEGISKMTEMNDGIQLEAGSGTYHFVSN